MRITRLVSGRRLCVLSCLTLLLLLIAGTVLPSAAQTVTCTTGALDPTTADGSSDLVVVTGPGCTVPAGTWKYKNVNIYGGGSLTFTDSKIDFYASSILVEDGGSLLAGTRAKPIGTAGGVVTIHIYGAEDASHHNKGITCKTGTMCNVPDKLWGSNSMANMFPDTCTLASAAVAPAKLPSWFVDDCFYGYAPIDYDDGDKAGYFGTKVLALSYGGTIQLFGQKGAQYPTAATLPAWSSGTSWARLSQAPDANTLVLDRIVPFWAVNDHIVVSSTDYLPGHAEEMQITANTQVTCPTAPTKQCTQLKVQQPGTQGTGLKYEHNASLYDISTVPAGIGPDDDPNIVAMRGSRKVETRAAVGLLTRSIRIVSEGDTVNQTFDQATNANPQYSFGAHSIVRQGFKSYQVQGVEFFQMGQGGEIMHYPIHFHMARKTPQPSTLTDPNTGTYVKDSSIHDSMTRWITLHATQGVTLARNVGYLSIGHGFYLEDGTETDNQLYSNLGVFARAALDNAQNPRQVPGILAATIPADTDEHVPYNTDVEHPAVFWITNTWNDFQYNAAEGAGSCGMCYWLPPSDVSGLSRYQVWSSSYAGEQIDQPDADYNVGGRAGLTPLKSFRGNSCSAAMNSFTTVGNTAYCAGTRLLDKAFPYMTAVPNPLAPPMPTTKQQAFETNYYPQVIGLAIGRRATECPAGDCRTVHPCDTAGLANCMVTVIDHYTTSFNWAEKNYSAMWMRPQWYLLSNSAITDVQNGGVTFVTGGDYTGANIVQGYWALAHKDVFIGSTQPDNPLASAAGPANNDPKSLKCATQVGNPNAPVAPYCLIAEEGVSFPLEGFAVNQRFFNIYDGPSYQSSNAYLEIKPSYLTGCNQNDGAACPLLGWMYGFTNGTLFDPHGPDPTDKCYLPNAAIGWKQPNAFFYPPAFRSNNLYFSDVPIRHFVVEPTFLNNTYSTNNPAVAARYCAYSADKLFDGFTDIDRQTELTDEDGTLTGLVSGSDSKGPTISVNQDPFFNAGRDDRECASDVHTFPTDTTPPLLEGTARTSPYEYVSTVVYPDCGLNCGGTTNSDGMIDDWTRDWANTCETAGCFGVPLHRLSLFQGDNPTSPPFIRMAGAGIAQRSTLTVNHASYYMNTTAKAATQNAFFDISKDGNISYRSLFQGGHTYYTFFLYATSSLAQTYKLYIGGSTAPAVEVVRANISGSPVTFTPAGAWPTDHMSYDGKILTVNVDTTVFMSFGTNYKAAQKAACQPASFCKSGPDDANGNPTCGCSLATTDPSWGECNTACGWAGKDIDCPMGGCYGFSVKMPDDFVASDQQMSPPTGSTSCPAATDAGWSTPFQIFNNPHQPDTCKYSQLPTDKFTSCQ